MLGFIQAKNNQLCTGHRWLFVGAALLALSSMPGFAQPQESPREVLQKAVRFHQAGDLIQAIEHYEQFLTLSTPQPDLLSNLGAAYAGVGNYEKAIASYERALEFDNPPPGIRFNLGLSYYKAARYQEALEFFELAVTEDPENFKAVLLSADVNFRLGEYGRVIEVLLPYEQSADNLALYYLLGTALIREGRSGEGAIYIDRVMRRGDPAAAHMMLGSARMMAGEMDAAAEEIKKAVELNPDIPGGHSMLGKSYIYLKEKEKAKDSFRRELETNPNDFDANLYLGSLLQQEQEYDQAMVYLAKARMMRPDDLQVIYQMAAIHLLQGSPEEARPLLEHVVAEKPDYIEAHVSLATAYHRLGMKEEANRERDIIVKLNAENDPYKPKERRVVGGPGTRTP